MMYTFDHMMTYLIHSLSACYFPDNTPPGQGTHLPPHTPPGSTDEECVCPAEPSSPGIHTTGGTGHNSKCYFPFIYGGKEVGVPLKYAEERR